MKPGHKELLRVYKSKKVSVWGREAHSCEETKRKGKTRDVRISRSGAA